MIFSHRSTKGNLVGGGHSNPSWYNCICLSFLYSGGLKALKHCSYVLLCSLALLGAGET